MFVFLTTKNYLPNNKNLKVNISEKVPLFFCNVMI